MGGPPMVDVREMLCAQALALVAHALAAMRPGDILEVRYNATDVKHDLVVWAQDRGYPVTEPDGATLQLMRR